MGLFDSVVQSVQKQARQNEIKARLTYSNKLSSAYHNTDDQAKKSAIAREMKANSEAIRNLK